MDSMHLNNNIDVVCESLLPTGSLYIGNRYSIADNYIEIHKITAILSVQDWMEVNVENVKVLHLKIEDKDRQSIKEYFIQTWEFISENLKTGNVLVQCMAGISRSAAFVIAYLILKRNWDYYQAYDYLKSKRDCIQPNVGFATQLEQFGEFFYEKRMNSRNYLNCVHSGQNKLYLGSLEALNLLKDFSIGAIVSVVYDEVPTKVIDNHLILKHGDMPKAQIFKSFDIAFEFIKNHLENTNVLVHCVGGVSRSSTIVIGYLMTTGMSLDAAFEQVKKARPIINPNVGFMRQLQELELELVLKKM